VSSQPGMCRPQIVSSSVAAHVELRDAIHPLIAQGSGSAPVPNTLAIGGTHPTLLLTGPNMAGKSTLMRTVCVATILAQVGCYVCASAANISPCDRIFTRIGARDAMLQGQSTLMVELAETSTILHAATRRSLVLVDELGRGTSTFDGCAIADGVLRYLAETSRPLMIFSTHYHHLAEQVVRHSIPGVAMGHMDYTLAATSAEVSSAQSREVVFLYRLVSGVCQRSYGIEVASRAGIPSNIVESARLISRRLESYGKTTQVMQLLSDVVTEGTDAHVLTSRARCIL
jgi:DNA mismatch repair protein MSH6